MSDPYATLGVSPEADDVAIREAYLSLAKQYSPENHPEKFAAIRTAYEAVRTLDKRARYRLFEAGKAETIDAILEDAVCRMPRRRLSLDSLLAMLHPLR